MNRSENSVSSPPRSGAASLPPAGASHPSNHTASAITTKDVKSTDSSSRYAIVSVVNEENEDEKRFYFTLEHHGYINPLHDIPLHADREHGVLNMVVEIPRWTNAKYELRTRLPLAPIMQDEKKGKPRFVQNVYPYKGYIWNYGCFPQTWEDPTQVHMETGALGDGDPLDVCEIGQAIAQVGQVKPVKVLGVLGMIDEGEMDWKVIVIDVRDPSAAGLNDVEDLYRAMPGLVHATFSWFRTYKVPDGKDENKFAFRERIQSRQYAVEIVNECHQSWKKLVAGKVKHSNHHCSNTTLSDTPLYMPAAAANRLVEEARASMRCSRGPATTTKGDTVGGDGNTPVSIDGASHARKGGGRLPRNLSIGQLETLAPPKFAQAPTSARHGGERVSATETIKRFLTEQQRHYPHGSSDLSLLITEIGTAAKIIAARIRDEPNGPMESLQHTAEMQLHAALAASGFCCMIYSSQSQRMMPLDPAAGIGNYVVVYTALLGQVGGSMGSIFSVYYRKSYSGREGDTADLLQRTGYEQVAAGYALYTSTVRLMLSTGLGVHMFGLDDVSGHFVLEEKFVQIPRRGCLYSLDTRALDKAIDGVREYVAGVETVAPDAKHFRYEENIVANVHRVFRHGGILLMPGPPKAALADFLGVAAPLAFMARQAGGKASVGKRPLLELSAWSLEMRVPLFIGSTDDVSDLEVKVLGHAVPERSLTVPPAGMMYA